MHAVPLDALADIEERLAMRIVDRFGLDTSSVALDMTNFATFIDTGNDAAPIAQRGKAKQKRTDLRLVGLGLVVTRDGGIPLLSHAYPGNKPDVTQFPAMIATLAARHAALAAATTGVTAGTAAHAAPDMTVVFDAGQNSAANFATLAANEAALRRVGARVRLPGPARPTRQRPHRRRPGPLRPAQRLRHPPVRLRRRTPHHPDPLTRTARTTRPAASTAPPWPRPAAASTSWPPPWPAARPADPAARSRPRSPPSPTTPGSGA